MRGINLSGFVCAIAFIYFQSSLHAGLQWDSKILEIRAKGSDKQSVGHFKFRNTGPTPVNILTVAASCSCTAAVADRKTYQPGETGEIVATFTLGGREGLSQKVITVVTDDPQQKNIFLNFNVFIPPVLTLDPPFLVWGSGEELTPKTVHISAGSDYPVHDLTVTSSNPNVEAKLATLSPGKEYQLSIVPKDRTARIIALVKVRADYPTDRPKAYFVTVHVQ